MQKLMRCLLLLGLTMVSAAVHSQDISGIWRGYFIAATGEQYKYEVQIAQSKKAGLSGVTYSYLDTRFYGKATLTGTFTKGTKAALVQEIKTVELKMSGGSVACIMKCNLSYAKSGKEEFLEGDYSSIYEKSDGDYGIKRGGDCGGGKVYLRKVPTSDFYVEPTLRNKIKEPAAPKIETAKTTTKPATKPTTKPAVTKPTTKPQTTTAKPTTKPPTQPATKPLPAPKQPEKVVVAPKIEPKIIPTPAVIRNRTNELAKAFTVSSNEVTISLYDNGEVDNDTVSIYLDGSLILSNKRLSTKPITYKLQMDEAAPEHTLVMVAENLGSIPPNTSLMIIQDGEKRYQVSITSTEQKNAMVRFRYQKQ